MYISSVSGKIGKSVLLRGWVYRKRESGGIIFVILRDRSGIIQVAIKKDGTDKKSWEDAQNTTIESSVIVKGEVRQDQRAPTGLELQASSFRNVQVAEPFPITEYQRTELLLHLLRHTGLRNRGPTSILPNTGTWNLKWLIMAVKKACGFRKISSAI